MGSKYEWDINPIQDFFTNLLMNDLDISKKENIAEIHDWLKIYYESFLNNENDIVYLDFGIKKDKYDNFNIVANNFITALWLMGIIPKNTNAVLKANKIEYKNKKYSFNKKTKELKIEKING